MNKSDLAPKEPETIRKSRVYHLILTAEGTTHTTEEATENVYGLDMFVQVQLLKDSPAVLA